nr:sarpagan bridge enzyme-like [Aegilops tauschii subsp. strangulata]
MCPGITFGLAVMEVALASLLFHFDWELPGGTEELDMAEAFGITARRKSDLWLHATVVVPPLSNTHARVNHTEQSKANGSRGTDFQLVPFGAGRRMCPGITFGLAVMEVALASLLFHFDWELPGGTEELDMAEAFGITARRKSDLWLHATVVVPPL